jgi:phasin family protein
MHRIIFMLRCKINNVKLPINEHTPHHNPRDPIAQSAAPGAQEMKKMIIDFTRQTEQMLNATKRMRIPDDLTAFVTDGVSKTRIAYEKLSALTLDNAKVATNVVLEAQAGVRKLGEKVLENASANAGAAFDAAARVVRAKTLPEAFCLQANFIRQQLVVVSAQTRELFELSTKLAQGTLDTFNSAAAKTFEQIKKAG